MLTQLLKKDPCQNDKDLFDYFFETLKRLIARRKETSARCNSLSSWFSLALAIRASARLRARSAREVSISSFLSAADATTDKTLFGKFDESHANCDFIKGIFTCLDSDFINCQ